MSNVSIYTSDLCIGYGTKVVQSGINLSLYEGEIVCMLGPNGCGKSTLLRTLAGLQPALGGGIRLGQDSSSSEGATDIIEKREQLLALVLTERLSLENTTIYDVVAMGRYPYTNFLGSLSARDKQGISKALEAVGISNSEAAQQRSGLSSNSPADGLTAQRTFNSLSDGEKQRVLIAKAIAQDTPIILLDEPTAHLDLPNRIQTLRLLRTLAHEQKKTILISTHELDLALAMSDRILLMSEEGAILDNAEHLKKTDAFTKAFKMDIFHPLCE